MSCHVDISAILMSMIPVATSEGVTVSCPRDGLYSFYNSPYPAHKLSTGIDVYSDAGFGEVSPSPVEGVVELTRRVKAPRGRGFRDAGYDYVTLIRSSENQEKVVKLLHVEPTLTVGDSVKTGQDLGALLRSGYYGFSTSPHVHVEVRKPSDPLRARGGHTFRRLGSVDNLAPITLLEGVVNRNLPEFTSVLLDGMAAPGLPADVGGVPGLLDGGIPYYGWLGAHTGAVRPVGETVRVMSVPVAMINAVLDGACLASCLPFQVLANGAPTRGLSLRLSPRDEVVVKLIPMRYGDLEHEVDSYITIELRSI